MSHKSPQGSTYRKQKAARTIRINAARMAKARTIGKEGFYESSEWRRLRYQAFKLNGAKCRLCGATAPGVQLSCDHIKPRSQFPHLALNIDNLQILCVDCNKGKGAWDQTDWKEARP